jgi:hypothetical protein
MNEKPSATVELYLANFNGTLSKKKYGTVIAFKTVLKRTGGNRFLIRHKDENNEDRWDPLKKNSVELELITQSLQIDVSNPLQAITQDDSSSFIKNTDPHQL